MTTRKQPIVHLVLRVMVVDVACDEAATDETRRREVRWNE
jgi:hypothetical protein